MKQVFLLLISFCTLNSCVSTKSTLKNVDDNAPELIVLKNNIFKIDKISTDKRYGYDPNYPINIFYRSTKVEATNEERFLKALAGPNGEKITYTRLETCCPFPTKRSDMGAGFLNVYELKWEGQRKAIKLYLNVYEKGYLMIPMGLTAKKD